MSATDYSLNRKNAIWIWFRSIKHTRRIHFYRIEGLCVESDQIISVVDFFV